MFLWGSFDDEDEDIEDIIDSMKDEFGDYDHPADDPWDSWNMLEDMERNARAAKKAFGTTENPKPRLNRAKKPGESWSDVLFSLSQEMTGTVDHAFKINYEEVDGQATGTFKGPGLDHNWDPEGEMAWMQGNPNLPLHANFEFEYINDTDPATVDRALSELNPNQVEVTIENPETSQEHQITVNEENESLEYNIQSEGWVTKQQTYEAFQDVKEAVQVLDIPVSVEAMDDPRKPEGNRVMDDFLADFTKSTEKGEAKFEDYEHDEYGKAQRMTVPETSDKAIQDHNYSEMFAELLDKGYEVTISGDMMTTTETENAVIHGSDYGFTITNNSVSVYRSLETSDSYEKGQVKQEMDEIEDWADEITEDRLTSKQWEMKPVNVIKPSQEQKF